MGWLLWTPAELSLNLEKGFEQQDTPGLDQAGNEWHPLAVEVVEQQYDIELTEIWPGSFEIGLDPAEVGPSPLGLGLTLAEPGGVAINRDDLGPKKGGGDGVSTGPAGQVEHSAARADQ